MLASPLGVPWLHPNPNFKFAAAYAIIKHGGEKLVHCMSIRRFGMMFILNCELVENKTTIVQQNKTVENVVYLYFIAECIGKDVHEINSISIFQEKR